MKKLFLPFASLAFLFLISCNDTGDSRDSVEAAEAKNDRMADSLGMRDSLDDDFDFLVDAASGGLMEVELGQLALQNAASADVKQFGQLMVTDHTKANAELKDLAARKNVTIPPRPGSDHQRHIDHLKDKKGADFDKDYMKMMVDDHEDDVEDFEEAAREAKDPDIRAFASKYAPILKEHLQKARTIKDKLT